MARFNAKRRLGIWIILTITIIATLVCHFDHRAHQHLAEFVSSKSSYNLELLLHAESEKSDKNVGKFRKTPDDYFSLYPREVMSALKGSFSTDSVST
jgi:hypothetical protein